MQREALECWSDEDEMLYGDCYATRANGAQLEDEAKSRAYLRMRINGHWVSCLVDSGCELTLLPARLVNPNQIEETRTKVRAANGTAIPVLGTTCVRGKIGSDKVNIRGLVSDQVAEPMLSIEWLKEHKAVWDFDEGTLRLRGRIHKLVAREREDAWVRRVLIEEDIDIPAQSELDVPVKVVCRDGSTLQDKKPTQWATQRKAL